MSNIYIKVISSDLNKKTDWIILTSSVIENTKIKVTIDDYLSTY